MLILRQLTLFIYKLTALNTPELADEQTKRMRIVLLLARFYGLNRNSVFFFPQTNETVRLIRFFFYGLTSVFTLLAFASKIVAETMQPDSTLRTPYQRVVGLVAIAKTGATRRLKLVFFSLIRVWFHKFEILLELLGAG